LRIIIVILNKIEFKNDVCEWDSDNRVKKKLNENDDDNKNDNSGLLLYNMGWMMVSKKNDVKEKGKEVEMYEIEDDKLIRLKKK
jgi:fatty-acid desaturase